MKKIFAILTLLFTSFIAFGQNGYRDFHFGMSIEDVRAIRSEIKVSNYSSLYSLIYIMQYLYDSELVSTIPNPIANITGRFTRYSTGDNYSNDMAFYFHNDKLVAIETYFRSTNILNELRQIYGVGFTVHLASKPNARVWNNQSRGRFIIWEIHTQRGYEYASVEEVIYVDYLWVRDLCSVTIENFRKSDINPRNRLD